MPFKILNNVAIYKLLNSKNRILTIKWMTMLRAICENPGKKKKSSIIRAAKNWQADSKTIRPKRQE